MSQPLVSVIIPTYNRLELLKVAIHSVQAQTFDAWELIVVDDGSTTGNADYVTSLDDARLQVVRLPHSGQMGKVRNVGVAVARAPYLAFLDSDDLWMPEKLGQQMTALDKTGSRWSYTGFVVVDADGHLLDAGPSSIYRPYSGDLVSGLLTTVAAVPIVSLVVDSVLFEEAGRFVATLRRRADVDLALRLALRADPVALHDPLVAVRHHSARSTAMTHDPYMDNVPLYQRFINLGESPRHLSLARKMLTYNLVSSAYFNAAKGRPKLAQQRLVEALWPGILTWRWWGAWLRLAKGVLSAPGQTDRSSTP